MPANIIDSLVVTLGLDPKQFGTEALAAQKRLDKFDATVKKLGIDEKKLTDVQRTQIKALREMQLQSDKAGKSLSFTSKIGGEMWGVLEKGALGFGAALGLMSLARTAENAVTFSAGIGRSAAFLGQATKEADAFGKAIYEIGGNADEAISTLRGLNSIIQGRQYGDLTSLALARAASLLGGRTGRAIDLNGANGQPLGPQQTLLAFADAVKTLGVQQAAVAFDQAGMHLPDAVVALLAKGRGGAEAAISAAGASAVDDTQAQAAQELLHGARGLDDAVSKFQVVATLLAAPAFVHGLQILTAQFQYWMSNKTDADKAARDAAIRASDIQFSGQSTVDARNAEDALNDAGVKNPGHYETHGKFTFWKDDDGGWTKDQMISRATHLIASGETPQNAAAIVQQEVANGGSPTISITRPLGGDTSTSFDDLEKQYGLPVGLLGSIRHVESADGTNTGPSSSGAVGDFQFLPSTAADLGIDPNDPKQAAKGAAVYLAQLIRKYGSVAKGIAAYNWGAGHLDQDILAHGDQWGNFLPNETSQYLQKMASSLGHGARTHSATINHNGAINVTATSPHASDIAHAVKTSVYGVWDDHLNKMGPFLVGQAQSGQH